MSEKKRDKLDNTGPRNTALPPVPELQRLRLQNLYLQQQLCREQLNVLTLQFLQTAQPKALQERIDDLTQQMNSIAEKIFVASDLDNKRYQFNVDTGVFVERVTRSQ